MQADLENLIVLQAQDLELARMRAELAELPRRAERAAKEHAGAEAHRGELQEAGRAEEKLRRAQESEIGAQRAKIERLRRSLDAATSSAQVGAFEKEIGFAEATVARLEEEEYASLERTEGLEAELVKAETLVAERTADTAAAAQRREVQGAALREQIRGVEGQRMAVRAAVAADRLAQYDRLSRVRGTAVAEALGTATEGKCAACQMAVRPQRWQDLIGRDHLDEIFTCESCGRMLFWDPRRDTPKPWLAGERWKAAQAGGTP